MIQEPWNTDSGDDVGTTFRDMITLALAGFMCLLILVLPHIGKKKQAEDGQNPPGNVIVEIRWPDEMATDVDLWVKAPGDVPVGYSNKSGLIFNLLRDDLGSYADPLKLNMETAYTRGVPPGEYIINVHLFRNVAQVYPVPVTLAVGCKDDPNGSTKQLATTKTELKFEGQEYTMLRLKINERCEVAPGSMNNLPRELRSAKK